MLAVKFLAVRSLNPCLTNDKMLLQYIQFGAVPVVNVGADQAHIIEFEVAPARDADPRLPR
jgi:hypothetical protein